MTWFKVDDDLAYHAKVVAAGNAAMGLWVRAGAWSGQHLTDGYVPKHILTTLGRPAEVKKLIAVGLWVEKDDGVQFHQWVDRQPSRAQVHAKREAAAERQRRAREAAETKRQQGTEDD